jgi:hypothetical protein
MFQDLITIIAMEIRGAQRIREGSLVKSRRQSDYYSRGWIWLLIAIVYDFN